MIIDNFTGEREFMSVEYKMPIVYSGTVFPSIEAAMIALLTDDQSIWQIISSTDDINVAYDLLPEIQANRVDDYDYRERLMSILLAKYRTDDFFTRLYNAMADEDKLYYKKDYQGVIANATEYIRSHGTDDVLGLSLYIQGEQ